MNVTPTEAEEALNAIRVVTQKTRRAISNSGAYIFLLIWGIVWLFGFLGSQFAPVETAGNIWIVLDILGGILSAFFGYRIRRGVRTANPSISGSRIGVFWLLLFAYCFAAIMVAHPVDGKQMAMFIILFVMVGWIAMGLLLSVVSIWWGVALTALALGGYFLLPDIFYLLMAILGGGGMIALGLYIRYRW
jgi:hypothetical protein